MPTMRPDGHPQHTSLPATSSEGAQPAHHPQVKPASPERGALSRDKDVAQTVRPHLVKSQTQIAHDVPVPQVPSKGQYQASKSAPMGVSSTKTGAKSSAVTDQRRTAQALMKADVHSLDLATQHLSQALIHICDKPEGFKSLIAVRPDSAWSALVCHDVSQVQALKGIDHQPLALNMSTTYSSPEAMGLKAGDPGVVSKSAKLRTEIFKGSMTPKPDGSTGVAGLYFAGTRLCRDPGDGNLVLGPSGRYNYNADVIGEAGGAMVAHLHAALLVGARVDREKIRCHPNHPGMQVLVDAIKQLMTPVED